MDFIQKFIREDLFKSTDIASLVFFRICFGALAVWEVIRFFYHGWVEHLYAKAPFHFKYEYFTWVEAWPGNGMHIHFFVVGLAALFIGLGLFYRISAIIFSSSCLCFRPLSLLLFLLSTLREFGINALLMY